MGTKAVLKLRIVPNARRSEVVGVHGDAIKVKVQAPPVDGKANEALCEFLAEQLHPNLFEAACRAAGQPLTLRRHEGYDHGYYFIQSFIADHLAHHARALG